MCAQRGDPAFSTRRRERTVSRSTTATSWMQVSEMTNLWAALDAERAGAGDFGGQSTRTSFRLPRALGRYVVEQAIGRGSMGAVLLARDAAIDRRVAVKLIQTSVQLTPPEWEQ